MTQRLDCSFGVVISASHNTYQDNGIKFFDATGCKLSDEAENEIECLLDLPVVTQESQHLGKAIRIDRTRTQYQQFCASTIPAGMTLQGFKIVIDCANGATFRAAPEIFRRLGADVEVIADEPDGRNINDGCGSTHLGALQRRIVEGGHDVGFAFDGDGDRLLAVDSSGTVVDGDELAKALTQAARGNQWIGVRGAQGRPSNIEPGRRFSPSPTGGRGLGEGR